MNETVTQPEIIVQAEGLTHAYPGTRGRKLALDGASFTVRRGEIHGFVGPNGAGKTTALKILATLLRPQRGMAKVFGLDVARHVRQVRARIGYMPDHFGLYRRMTVREYLDFFGAAYGLSSAIRRQTIDDVLQLTEMQHRSCDVLEGLSRGLQQRVGLARVLVHDPQLLLLDEPASGLDPRARIDLMDILRTLARNLGKTVFISSHILGELQDLCDSATIIDRGIVRFSGSFDDLPTSGGGQQRYRLQLRQPAPWLQPYLHGIAGVTLVEEECTADQRGFGLAIDEQATSPGAVLGGLLDRGIDLLEFSRIGRRLDQAFLELTEPGVGQ
jgi:ABC-2 type transport system ATP-binding protein